MSAIRLCLTDPSLRAAGLILALQGAVACSFGPYFSTLAVNSFGFGDRGYAILLALSSLASIPLPAAETAAPATRPEITFATDPAPSTYVPGPRQDTLITGATVLDGSGGRQRADVLLRDGKVAGYGPGIAAPPGAGRSR